MGPTGPCLDQDKAQICFGYDLYRLITSGFVSLTKKYRLYTFLDNRPSFGVILNPFGSYGAILGASIMLKTVLGSIRID